MLSSQSPSMLPRSASSRQANYANLNFQSMTNDWEKTFANTGGMSTSDSILKQSVPAALAAPAGWRSEIVQSSSTSNSTRNPMQTNLVDRQDEYTTMNSYDAPPMIYSSTSEVNRVIDEIPSAAILSSSPKYDYGQATLNSSTIRERNDYITGNQSTAILQNLNTEQPPPLVVHKKLANDQITYQQNISVKYLQPPTPPPPGPIIIREVRPPPPAPASPIQVRQRPPPPATPPPIVIRERPPPAPPRQPSQVVEKLLPPPPRPPPRMIVERFASCPPKPPDMIIERWLPYRRSDQRRVLVERAPAPFIAPREPNLVILHEPPRARVEKEFINQGVVRADPESYIQRYGSELHSGHTQFGHLLDEAARSVPPPHIGSREAFISTPDYPYPSSYPSPHLAHVWDRMRSASPMGHSVSSYHDHWRHDQPYHAYSPSFSRSGHSSLQSYDEYPTRRGNFSTMVDVTPSWGRYCNSPASTPAYMPSYTAQTIRVRSDGELQNVLSDLTHGRVPSSLRSY